MTPSLHACSDPSALRALTVPLPDDCDLDLMAVASQGGSVIRGPDVCVAGWGSVAELEIAPHSGGLRAGGAPTSAPVAPWTSSAVVSWLAAIPLEDHVRTPGSGPLALGALPFSPAETGVMVVPAFVVGTDETGRRWATAISDAGRPRPSAEALVARAREDSPQPDVTSRASGTPGGFEALRSEPSESEFVSAVEEAVEAITRGTVDKVVLARRVEALSQGPVDVSAILRRLGDLERGCTVFAVADSRGGSVFVGASPEILVSRRSTTVSSHPLAGTVGLSGDRAEDHAAITRLETSAKELQEHRLVARAVAVSLAPCCEKLESGPPQVVRLRTVAHLGTRLSGTLISGPEDQVPDALRLALCLHPTPAVAGTPTRAALALLARLERQGRGPYAGPVGWVDSRGDGDFVVGIRSAQISGRRALVYAGAGIVAASDAKEELAETTLKLRTALEALGALT